MLLETKALYYNICPPSLHPLNCVSNRIYQNKTPKNAPESIINSSLFRHTLWNKEMSRSYSLPPSRWWHCEDVYTSTYGYTELRLSHMSAEHTARLPLSAIKYSSGSIDALNVSTVIDGVYLLLLACKNTSRRRARRVRAEKNINNDMCAELLGYLKLINVYLVLNVWKPAPEVFAGTNQCKTKWT